MPVPVEMLMIGASLILGVVICALLITPLLRHHFRKFPD